MQHADRQTDGRAVDTLEGLEEEAKQFTGFCCTGSGSVRLL
ncbi:MAG: hypothetical protein ACLUPB_15345 [Agathobacter rectalis]